MIDFIRIGFVDIEVATTVVSSYTTNLSTFMIPVTQEEFHSSGKIVAMDKQTYKMNNFKPNRSYDLSDLKETHQLTSIIVIK